MTAPNRESVEAARELYRDLANMIVRACTDQEAIERIAAAFAAVRAAEREKVAAWMISKSIATGHGDTIEDLLNEIPLTATRIGEKS